MKIWAAGETGDIKRKKGIIQFLPQRLLSYYFLNVEESSKKTMKCDIKNKIELFLDSGAYSAWSQGVKINIKGYIKFIKKHKKYLNVYANLDVIGDPKATLKNQKIMEREGLKPLPCFHFNEDKFYLKQYIENYSYIALGGMVGKHKKQLDPWLSEIFNKYICDKEGIPKVMVHGFGLTSLPLMIKYPWYSVDSTSWTVTSRMGQVLIPHFKDGKYKYDIIPHKISVSSISPDLETKYHINNLSPIKKKIFLKYLEEKGYKLGKSEFRKESINYKLKKNEKWAEKKIKGMTSRLIEKIVKRGLSNDYKLRDEINIIYFKDLENYFPKYPRKFKLEDRKQNLGL